VYLGEEVEPLGDTASEVSGKSRVHYSKVRLVDGKECWIRTDFIALGYKPAVAFHNTGIFSRPDRVAVTGKRFDDFEVVAVKMVKYGWLEVKGIAAGEKWFTKGYINAGDVLVAPEEVEFAALMKRADVAKDPKIKDALEAQYDQFSGTEIYASLYGIRDEVIDEYEEGGDDLEDQEYVVSTGYLLGEWGRSWSDQDNNEMSETIVISDDLRYAVIGQDFQTSITELAFDTDNQTISFVKAGPDSKVKIELTAISYSVMKGTESQGEGGSIDVIYTRVGY